MNEILKINIIVLFSSGITIMNFTIIAGFLNMIIKLTLGDNFLTAGLSFTDDFPITKSVIIVRELIVLIIKLIVADNFLIIFLIAFCKIFSKNCQ